MPNPHDKPLIYTSKGNLPIEDLQYENHWEFIGSTIKFSEIWRLNGEIVKQNAHGYVKEGLLMGGEQQQVG